MIDSPDALKELLPNVSRETIEKLAEFREMILAEDQNLISKNDKNKLASLDLSIDDEDVDFSNIKIDYNIGQKPGKGKINLTFYYYMKDSVFKLKTYKKNKKICLSVGSFGNLAIAPSDASDEETQEFEYALQGNEGGESMYKFQFVFDDGKIIECDSDRNELIESISKYLISKGAFNK